MSDPRELPVINTQSKKAKVKERTIAERKYCAIDQFYYSEMFTCPICYGVEREQERIIKLLEDPNTIGKWWSNPEANIGLYGNLKNFVIALIKGEQK